MPSKKKVEKKPNTKPPLEAAYGRQFPKDWQELERSGKDMQRLKGVMLDLIANSGPLAAIHREHKLSGNWAGFHECHIGGDLLLIYDKSEHRIVFARAGSHAALFEN